MVLIYVSPGDLVGLPVSSYGITAGSIKGELPNRSGAITTAPEQAHMVLKKPIPDGPKNSACYSTHGQTEINMTQKNSCCTCTEEFTVMGDKPSNNPRTNCYLFT